MLRDWQCSKTMNHASFSTAAGWHVHDNIAQVKEALRRQGLHEEVRDVFSSVLTKGTRISPRSTASRMNEVSALDMLSALMVLWIVRKVNGTMVIY